MSRFPWLALVFLPEYGLSAFTVVNILSRLLERALGLALMKLYLCAKIIYL
ncbi:MAG: hypothetical protein Q4D41_12315 [Prevotellaceae bacterium]|nr:hypothetical protein [Prevotellaceae bacterium]